MPELNNHAERPHAFLSASASERWMHCHASARLAALYPNTETAFTKEGTLAHEVAEAVATGGSPDRAAMAEGVTEEMIRHAEAYRDYIFEQSKPGSVVMLEQRVDFSPWVPDGFGTADCIIMSDDVLNVIDYKYGQGVEVSAVRNPQMMLYGLGALNEYGYVYDVNRVRLHIFQPRKDNVSTYELSVEELKQFGASVVEAAADCMSEHPTAAAGSWCKFCPHAGRCTELTLHCIGSISGEYETPQDITLRPEGVARLLQLEPVITSWLKKVKEQALADMLNGQDVPGYKVVEGKQGNRAWADELKVAAALDAAGISREDYTTVSLLSPAAMDKALGKKRAAELLGSLITRSAGAPTIAPASDKRARYNPADEFQNLEA